jgi:hypothetical protein
MLIAVQLVKNIHCLLLNPKIHYHVQKSTPLGPTVSQFSPVDTLKLLFL